MRTVIFLVAVLSANSAGASFVSGNDLKELCRTNESVVLGYVAGWADKHVEDVDSVNAAKSSSTAKQDMEILGQMVNRGSRAWRQNITP